MPPALPDHADTELKTLLEQNRLTALFQPIATLASGTIYGYEGLIRGPSNSFLHSPINLFRTADHFGLLIDLDIACRRTIIEAFAREALPGRLFLNISPACLVHPSFRPGTTLELLRAAGIPAQRVVIELTEMSPADDFDLLRQALLHYRDMGFRIALDDLGEGFSSLRLWSELQPDFVKIDKYFIQGVASDTQKRQFVRSIQHIAHNSNTRVIAEGVETRQELEVVQRIGIEFVQGYYLAKPMARPPRQLPMLVPELPRSAQLQTSQQCAGNLLTPMGTASQQDSNKSIYDRFAQAPALHAIPVVTWDGIPIGLLKRNEVLERFARPYTRELYGQRSCTMLMDPSPLIVEQTVSLQELSKLVTSCDRRYLADGFIITDKGHYLGMGSSHDLMRMITDLQIQAARYANPLTQLPGNVPIQERIQSLLDQQQPFTIIYADLDYFKPFNDVFGYALGDAIIQMAGKLLAECCDATGDFVGHIGGDDFILLMLSADWQERCTHLLNRFDEQVSTFFTPEARVQGGYHAPDRCGELQWYPLTALSLGAVEINPALFENHLEVASSASQAKKQAKKNLGSFLFIERRQTPDSAQNCAPQSAAA